MSPAAWLSFLRRDVAGAHVGGYPEFPDFARDQMAVLTACIQNSDLGVVRKQIANNGYFRILSTMILCALLKRAWAFGMASMACIDFGIGFDLVLAALVHVERGLIDFGLEQALRPVVILREIGFGEVDLLLQHVIVKIVHGRGDRRTSPPPVCLYGWPKKDRVKL